MRVCVVIVEGWMRGSFGLNDVENSDREGSG